MLLAKKKKKKKKNESKRTKTSLTCDSFSVCNTGTFCKPHSFISLCLSYFSMLQKTISSLSEQPSNHGKANDIAFFLKTKLLI